MVAPLIAVGGRLEGDLGTEVVSMDIVAAVPLYPVVSAVLSRALFVLIDNELEADGGVCVVILAADLGTVVVLFVLSLLGQHVLSERSCTEREYSKLCGDGANESKMHGSHV